MKPKLIIWLFFLLAATGTLLLSLQSLSDLYAYFERARITDEALNLIKPRRAAPGLLVWEEPDPGPRRMEDFTRDAITSDYLLAYEELTHSLFTGDTQGLRSYFQGAALEDTKLSSANPKRSQFVSFNHKLTLHFYAPDGATVAFTDHYYYAQGFLATQDLVDIRMAQRGVDIIMRLDDGNWRIHHWRVLSDTPLQFQESDFDLNDVVSKIQGINYTPFGAPFDAFWPNFDASELEADFALIRRLGLNTVRFFIPYPSPEGLESHLPVLLELAQTYNLALIPTLFDGYTRYAFEDLPVAENYLRTIVQLLDHPAVLMIDIKNEADLDFARSGHNRLRSFLTYMMQLSRQLSQKPVLIGLISPDEKLSEIADVISLHHFGTIDELRTRVDAALKLGKPVLLEEFGFHTWRFKLPDPHTELEQAWYYQQVLDLAETAQIGWLAWTLHDLPQGAMPGGRNVERHLGIVRANGQTKPVIAVLLGIRAEPPPFYDRFRKLNWVYASFSLILVMVLLQRFYKKKLWFKHD